MKHSSDRSKFLEILRDSPWISFACKKTGISRATIYRWMKDIPEFKDVVTMAIKSGNSQLGEIAEMGLAKKIKEGNLNAIKYFLAHNNRKYIPKRSIYVLPPDHTHYDEPERCERCGRLSIIKETEKKENRERINNDLRELANPKNLKYKQTRDKLLKTTLETATKKPR